MIMGVVYPCIGIGYWIGSYLTVHRIIDHRGGVLMYWNWGLDWVISHCHITIIMVMNGVPICMGMVYWNGSYQMMHMK